MGTKNGEAVSPRRMPWDSGLLQLYIDHFSDLVASAERILRSRMIAEEVVQEAFLQFHLRKKKPSAGSELSYLRSMALNNARTILRRTSMASARCDRDLPPTPLSVEDQCVQSEEFASLAAALQNLSIRQRQVLWLRHGAGLSEQETARVLSIGEGSVKTHAWRARAALRDAMSERLAA